MCVCIERRKRPTEKTAAKLLIEIQKKKTRKINDNQRSQKFDAEKPINTSSIVSSFIFFVVVVGIYSLLVDIVSTFEAKEHKKKLKRKREINVKNYYYR